MNLFKTTKKINNKTTAMHSAVIVNELQTLNQSLMAQNKELMATLRRIQK